MATETVHLHPEDAAVRITGQIALVQWIESARLTLRDLESTRTHYPEVDRLMKYHGVRSPIEWDDPESNALQFMLIDMSERVEAMAAAKMEAKHV